MTPSETPSTEFLCGHVSQTIRNQEELRVSDEKVTLLQDELNTLRRQHAEVEGGAASRELQNQAGRHSDDHRNKIKPNKSHAVVNVEVFPADPES